MSILTLTGIRKEFVEGDPLLEDVTFAVAAQEKAALIGENGTGKTTLLRMIAGHESWDGGALWVHPSMSIGYLAQDADLPADEPLLTAVSRATDELRRAAEAWEMIEQSEDSSVAEGSDPITNEFAVLGGYEFERRARETLLQLGFVEGDLIKPVRVLSGGQKTRAMLARLLLTEPDLLLLDEPTNHLDIPACEWLQDFLTTYRGAALIVSHDRFFLDAVVTKVIVLSQKTAAVFAGNYTQTAEKRAALRDAQQKLHEVQQREIDRMDEMIQRLRVWAGSKGSGGKLWKQVFSKEKALDRMKEQQTDRPARQPRAMRVRAGPSQRGGNEVLRLRDLVKRFRKSAETESDCETDERHWSLAIDHVLIQRGQRVGLVGPNGSGKTTLLKMIMEYEPATEGTIQLGANLTVAYFAQEFSHLRDELSVLEEFVEGTDLLVNEARSLMAKYLFTGEDVFKPVSVLSGGEKCRLALGKLLLQKPNLLLLDEPTNHLDIISREALEGALREFQGTMLIASHDRYLLSALANRILEVRDGHGVWFDSTYREYRERTLADQPGPEPAKPANRRTAAVSDRPPSVAVEARRQRAQHRERVRKIEEEISLLEAQLAIVTACLANPQTYRGGEAREKSAEYQTINERLNELQEEWEKLAGEGS